MSKLKAIGATFVLAVALAAPAHAACRALYANGPELWALDANGDAHRIARDEKGFATARFSPNRERIAYVQQFDLRGEVVSHIVVLTAAGERVADIPVAADLGINDVLNFGWLDDKRVWTEGHVTPSSGMYHEWDVATGRVENEHLGAWFAPSPDGKSLAYREHVPHGAPASLGDRVLIDDRVVYPAENDSRSHRLRELAWNDKGQLTLVDEVGGQRTRVVVDGGRGHRLTANAIDRAEPQRKTTYVDVKTNRAAEAPSKTTVEAFDTICE